MKRLLLLTVVLAWAVPVRAVTIQVIPEGNTVQTTVGNFTNEAGVATKPITVVESVDTIPAGTDSTNLWLHAYTDADVAGTVTYSLTTVIPWGSWAIPTAMRRQSQINVRFSYRWCWYSPTNSTPPPDRCGTGYKDVTLERTNFPRATPTP